MCVWGWGWLHQSVCLGGSSYLLRPEKIMQISILPLHYPMPLHCHTAKFAALPILVNTQENKIKLNVSCRKIMFAQACNQYNDRRLRKNKPLLPCRRGRLVLPCQFQHDTLFTKGWSVRVPVCVRVRGGQIRVCVWEGGRSTSQPEGPLTRINNTNLCLSAKHFNKGRLCRNHSLSERSPSDVYLQASTSSFPCLDDRRVERKAVNSIRSALLLFLFHSHFSVLVSQDTTEDLFVLCRSRLDFVLTAMM